MAGSSAQLHEELSRLSTATVERHRAIVSLMEELEAVDWYDQRVDACEDDDLRGILRHNRDEEKEHAAMTLEWLRRHDPKLDEHLRRYLFTDGPIADRSPEAGEGGDAGSGGAGSLGVGGLRGKEGL
jgi:ferritin-like protein